MKILWLTREDPFLLDRGDLIYSAGLITALAELGAAVTVLCFQRNDIDTSTPPNVRRRYAQMNSWHRIWSLFSKLPSDAYRHRSPSFQKLLQEELDKGDADVVVVDYYAMGWVLDAIALKSADGFKRRAPAVVYLSHHYEQVVRSVVASGYRGDLPTRLVLSIDASKGMALERRLVKEAALITTITDSDRDCFLKDVPNTPVLALTPGYAGVPSQISDIRSDRQRNVLLVGAFDWIAKKQNLKEFVLAANDPFKKNGIKLVIVGRASPAYMDEIRSLSAICEFVGPVADVQPYLRDARIGLMPDTLGGGFKLKYLDYIFGGLPVATISSQLSGLPVDPDRDVIGAMDACQLAERIVSVIDEVDTLNGMAHRAFNKCRDAFEWSTRGKALFAAITQLTNEQVGMPGG
ncbi:MAG: glycosyltransferase [Rhizomicrobium sp.]